MRYVLLLMLAFLLMPETGVHAQRKQQTSQTYDPALFDTLQFRMIGPFRGGDQPLSQGYAVSRLYTTSVGRGEVSGKALTEDSRGTTSRTAILAALSVLLP